MKKLALLAAISALTATPASATGGLVCSTAGPRPIVVSMGFSHSVGASLVGTHLSDDGRDIAVHAPQWWLDGNEVRLLLTDPNAERRELILRATRKGEVYDGNVWRGGKRRWVRCREG